MAGVLRVTLRGADVPAVVLGSGDVLAFGRAPAGSMLPADPGAALRRTALALPRCAPFVSRLLGELAVGRETARLHWYGRNEAQLSSLFDAPGGARRVVLTAGMSALLDDGDNQVLVLRGREEQGRTGEDLVLTLDVGTVAPPAARPVPEPSRRPAATTAPAPGLAPSSRDWYVALALCEPWLSGSDDYPRPPSNREIYERVLGWRGDAWNLERPQRVDDAIRAVARTAFGPSDDPFAAGGRAQNLRFAIGRRAAEVRLVTADDLDRADRDARAAAGPAAEVTDG